MSTQLPDPPDDGFSGVSDASDEEAEEELAADAEEDGAGVSAGEECTTCLSSGPVSSVVDDDDAEVVATGPDVEVAPPY